MGGLIGQFSNNQSIDDLLAPFAGFSDAGPGTPSAFALLRFLCTHPDEIGRLEVLSGETSLVFAIGEGTVWSSSSSEETDQESVCAVIQAERLIRPLLLDECIEASEQSGIPLVRVLFEKGLLDRKQLVHVLASSHRNRINALLSMAGGEFFFNPVRTLEELTDGLAVPFRMVPFITQLVRETLNDLYSQDLEVYQGELRSGWLTLKEGSDDFVEKMRLPTREVHVIDLLRSHASTLESFPRASVLGESNAIRFLVFLQVFDLLETTTEAPADPDSKTPMEAAELFLAKTNESDLFTRVGAHFTSHPYEMTRGVHELKRRYGPGSPASTDEELQGIASQIWALVSEAWDLISEKEKRIAYRDETFTQTERQTAAELLYKQGKMAVFRGQIDMGKRLFESASELDPQPTYEEAAQNPMRDLL